MAASAWSREYPSARLNENDVEIWPPVCVTAVGVVLLAKWLNAASGMTFSLATLTADPVEVLPRPPLASAFAARLRAASFATEVADEAVVLPPVFLKEVVPATA